MQQFTVPQFIDVEDKIFGPITIRQFVILLFAAGLAFVFWKLFDRSLAITLIVIFDGFAFLLAFLKVKGQLFHIFLLNIIQTLKKPALRIWKIEYLNEELKQWIEYKPKKLEMIKFTKKPVTASRLKELTLVVNTGGVYRPDEY